MNAAIHPRPAAERAPSYYAATLNEETDYPTLLGAVTVDIAIIGGGFTGVATAVELAERGYKVALVETHRIGWGASGRNGGQVTGSLSGDAAMHKQMRQWLGAEVEDFMRRARVSGERRDKGRARLGIGRCRDMTSSLAGLAPGIAGSHSLCRTRSEKGYFGFGGPDGKGRRHCGQRKISDNSFHLRLNPADYSDECASDECAEFLPVRGPRRRRHALP